MRWRNGWRWWTDGIEIHMITQDSLNIRAAIAFTHVYVCEQRRAIRRAVARPKLNSMNVIVGNEEERICEDEERNAESRAAIRPVIYVFDHYRAIRGAVAHPWLHAMDAIHGSKEELIFEDDKRHRLAVSVNSLRIRYIVDVFEHKCAIICAIAYPWLEAMNAIVG